MSFWKRLLGAKGTLKPGHAGEQIAEQEMAGEHTEEAPLHAIPEAERSELYAAIGIGKIENVRALLARNPDLVFSRNKQGATPLHLAARERGYHEDRSTDITRLLLTKKARVNAKNDEGKTALHFAAEYGQKEIASLLLGCKAEVNALDNEGFTPLHYASLDRTYRDVADLLRSHGGKDDIHGAAKAGDLTTVEALLKSNPDLVFSKKTNGNTPLHYAARWGRLEVMELLLANKADVNARANNGQTPLHSAAFSSWDKITELLLTKNANPNARDDQGWTPLHWTARLGHRDSTKLLLTNNADVNARTADGLTPLHCAALHNDVPAVELLLANKADMDAKTGKGETALVLAADNGCKNSTALLRRMRHISQRTLCPVCGSRMREEGAPLTLSCAESHDRISYYSFDDSYATLSQTVASLLRAKGYEVEKSREGGHYNVTGSAST